MLLAFEMALGLSHSRPEPYVHGAEYDEAPSHGEGVENPLYQGGYGIELPVHPPESLLELINRHTSRPEDHGSHIVFAPILGQYSPLILQPPVYPRPRKWRENRQKGPLNVISLREVEKLAENSGLIVVVTEDE